MKIKKIAAIIAAMTMVMSISTINSFAEDSVDNTNEISYEEQLQNSNDEITDEIPEGEWEEVEPDEEVEPEEEDDEGMPGEEDDEEESGEDDPDAIEDDEDYDDESDEGLEEGEVTDEEDDEDDDDGEKLEEGWELTQEGDTWVLSYTGDPITPPGTNGGNTSDKISESSVKSTIENISSSNKANAPTENPKTGTIAGGASILSIIAAAAMLKKKH